MTPEVLFFFQDHLGALPIYEALEAQILAIAPDCTVKVQKTQITFKTRYGFAFVSFTPVRPAAKRPKDWLTLSFGLGHRLDDPRIDQASEPYPGRWTHHVMLGTPEEVDDTVVGWLQEAADFAARKDKKGAPPPG